jgi:hypothetical protein
MTLWYELVSSMKKIAQFESFRPMETMNYLADFWMMCLHPLLTSLQNTKRIFTLFVLCCWIGIIILEKYSLVSFGSFLLLMLSLRRTKESYLGKMPGWFGPKPLKHGRTASGHQRSFLGLGASITDGGIAVGIPPNRSEQKEPTECTTSSLIGGWECLSTEVISSVTTMSSDGTRGERSDDPTEAGEDPEAVRGEKTNKKGKKKDDSDMVVDGADSQKAKGTKRKETGNPEGNDPPEDDESEDEGRKKNITIEKLNLEIPAESVITIVL